MPSCIFTFMPGAETNKRITSIYLFSIAKMSAVSPHWEAYMRTVSPFSFVLFMPSIPKRIRISSIFSNSVATINGKTPPGHFSFANLLVNCSLLVKSCPYHHSLSILLTICAASYILLIFFLIVYSIIFRVLDNTPIIKTTKPRCRWTNVT